MSLQLNAPPYFDDFDADKSYHKILFIPDRPLQSRELTQIQTMIHNQIKINGDFNFKNGSKIIGGDISLENNVTFIKLNPIFNGVSVDNYIDTFKDKLIVGQNTGVKARVVHVEPSTNDDPPTLYIQYTSGSEVKLTDDESTFYSVFQKQEALIIENASRTVEVEDTDTFTGTGSLATVQEGIFYINGYFVQNGKQTITLNKYGTTPSNHIGLIYEEKIATAQDDPDIFNNASGFLNETSQGADRLQINLNLTKFDYYNLQDNNEEFIILLSIKDGVVQKQITTTALSKTGDILARRTSRESGDYIKSPFDYKITNYRKNNRGAWQTQTPYVEGDVIYYTINNKKYYATALTTGISSFSLQTATHGTITDNDITWLITDKPYFNNGIEETRSTDLNQHIAESNLYNIRVSKGKAYIKGYEVNLNTGWQDVQISKNNTNIITKEKEKITPPQGQYFIVNNIRGLPNISDNNFLAEVNLVNFNSEITGTVRIRNFHWKSGVVGSVGMEAAVYVVDVAMLPGKTLSRDAQFIAAKDGTFRADIVGNKTVLAGNATSAAVQSGSYIQAGSTITISMTAHGYTGGEKVTIVYAGASPDNPESAAYTIATVPDVDTFTVEDPYATEETSRTGGTANIFDNAISGQGSRYTIELGVGDSVLVTSETNGESQHMVTSITDNSTITLEPAILFAESGLVIRRVDAVLYGENGLVQNLKHEISAVADVKYHINRMYEVQALSSEIVLNVSNRTESFVSSAVEYTLVANASGAVPMDTVTMSVTGQGNSQLRIAGVTAGLVYRILTVVQKKGTGVEFWKDKTRKYKTIYINKLNDVDSDAIPLTEADVTRIITIKQSGGDLYDFTNREAAIEYDSIGEIEVTEHYNLVSNSGANLYGRSALSRIDSFIPSAPIEITFEYYDHDQGDFFVTNSYKDTPKWMQPLYAGVSLSNCIDYRSRINDAGDSFVGGGASVSEPISTFFDLEITYDHYIPRKDTLGISVDGNFRVNTGDAALKPVAPLMSQGYVEVAYLTSHPYSYWKEDLSIVPLTMKGYTMKDIKKIDDRLTNVEQINSLGGTFDQVTGMQITDTFGLNRYKSGYMTDMFGGFAGDPKDPDYEVAIDTDRKEARPAFFADDLKLIETEESRRKRLSGPTKLLEEPYEYTTQEVRCRRRRRRFFGRGSRSRNCSVVQVPRVGIRTKTIENADYAHYTVSGDLVTLPYSEVPFIENKKGTTPEFVTPLTHFRALNGMLDVFPQMDTWMSEKGMTVNHQFSEGPFNSVVDAFDKTFGLGAKWESWIETSRVTIVDDVTTTQTGSSTNTTSRATSTRGNELSAQINTTTRTDRFVTTTNMHTDIDFERQGVETTIDETIEELGSVITITDTNFDPMMRERALVLYGRNFMPNTGLLCHIDQTNVSGYVSPGFMMTMESNDADKFFDYKNSPVDNNSLELRQYGENTYDILDRGEIIQGQTSRATAVLIAIDADFGNSQRYVIHNIKGTFQLNETILGLTSRAAGTLTVLPAQMGMSTTDTGNFFGILTIPNNDEIRFPARVSTITLADLPPSESANRSTSGSAQYNGMGITYAKETTVLSVKNAVVTRRELTETRRETENFSTQQSFTTSTVTGTTRTAQNCNCDCNCNCVFFDGGGDPLAQTFKHNDAGGLFITSIDLYFHSVNQNESSPVFIELREVVNGYPGGRVLPGSAVTKRPSQITSVSETALLPTNFKFAHPVYLAPDVEYCIVVGSDFDITNETQVWTSMMGQTTLDGEVIIKQPLMGSMFKSQNGRTWEAFQLSDLCFKMYKAKFDIKDTGIMELTNITMPYRETQNNPFRVKAGHDKARLYMNDHGLLPGDTFTVEGSTSVDVIDGVYMVDEVTLDTVLFTLRASVTVAATGFVGGADVRIQSNRKYDNLYLNGKQMVLPNTNVNYTYNPYVAEGATRIPSNKDYRIHLNKTTTLDQSGWVIPDKYLDSDTNEFEHSFKVNAYLMSNNENISPVIDLSSFSARFISNRVNNEDITINKEVDKSGVFSGQTFTPGIQFTAASSSITFDSAHSAYFNTLRAIRVGSIIEFSGNANAGQFTVVSKSEDTDFTITVAETLSDETFTGSLTMDYYTLFLAEFAPDDTTNAGCYVSKTMTVTNPATGFRLLYDYNVPSNSDIRVFYRTDITGSDTLLREKNWVELLEGEVAIEYLTDDNPDFFIEKLIDFDVDQYDQIQFKMELRGDGTPETTKVPKIKNFRVIAVA